MHRHWDRVREVTEEGRQPTRGVLVRQQQHQVTGTQSSRETLGNSIQGMPPKDPTRVGRGELGYFYTNSHQSLVKATLRM